jgi:hypothetical protein
MKRLFLSILIVLALLPSSQAQSVFQVNAGQTLSTTNNGLITEPPHINAVNFINFGTIAINTIFREYNINNNFSYILTPRPFETFNTLNFTNYGTMQGMNGWRFSLNPDSSSTRRMASSFANLNGGIVQGVDPFAIGYYTGGFCAPSAVDPSYLLIWATNIVSGGGIASDGSSLKVGVNGLIDLVGQNVNLAHSGLEVTPVWSQGQGTSTDVDVTTFVPDLAYYDLYWAQSSFNDNYALNSRGLWNGAFATSLGIPVAQGAAPVAIPGFSLPFPEADSYINAEQIDVTVTNILGDPETVTILSNVIKGAVFVGVPPGFNVTPAFFPSSQFNNRFNHAEVLLTSTVSNAVTGAQEAVGFYISDSLAANTVIRGNALNVLYCSSPQTFRPAPYSVDRLLFVVGTSGNFGYPDADFLVNSGNFDPRVLFDQATNAVTDEGDFAAYGVYADNLASRPAGVPNATATNFPGRVVISADNLNLDHTRIRGEGRIQITTPHLISSTNAVIDSENLSFDLGSRTEDLNVQSMVPPNETVARFKGSVFAWSAMWSNQVTVIIENYAVSNIFETNIVDGVTNVVTNIVTFLSPITNTLGVGYHTLMVDARNLTTVAPSYVFDLRTRSTDVTIDDSMTVIENLLIDGRSLTLNNSFRIPGFYPPSPLTGITPPIPFLRNWVGPNAPNLLHLTNNGSLSIENEGHFGDDRPPYANVINNGQIAAFGLNVDSDYFENSGNISIEAGLFLRGGSAKLENGSSSATTITRFSYKELKFNNYQHNGGVGPVSFYVTNSLSDAGEGSGNVIQVRNGINLLIKPAIGDLLGTRIQSTALHGSLVTHAWAGENRGPTPAGFANNVAIGTLVLEQTNSNAKFSFAGTGANKGLYVDLLDLSTFTTSQALLSQLQISPNLVIYYAAARLGFTPPTVNGVAQLPEEYLDGLFNGRLRWVPTYAGPNSGQPLLVNGQTIQVNKALFNSQLIDSDNDGIPNGSDPGSLILVSAPITVEVFGNGTVTPDYNGALLLLDGVYSVTATPAKGAVFTGWTGSIESSSPLLIFTNTGDIFLVANFEFQVTPGTYSGLFYESDGIEMFRSGHFTAKTTKSGSFSGMVRMGAERFSFSGQVDEDGRAFPGAPLFMDLRFESDRITGTIGDDDWTAELHADLASFGKTNRAAFAGRYTMAFRGSGSITNTALPFGDGYGTASVDSSGKIKIKGVLADGSKVTQTAMASANGQWPLYVPLYGGAGQILGWMSFEGTAEQDVGGDFNWIKDPADGTRFYPDGFNFSSHAIGSVYLSDWSPVTGFEQGRLILSGGNLPDDVVADFLISTKNKITISGTNKTKLTINAGQGSFKGSVPNPATGKPLNFNGVILQKQSAGAGFFLGTNQSGKVTIITP